MLRSESMPSARAADLRDQRPYLPRSIHRDWAPRIDRIASRAGRCARAANRRSPALGLVIAILANAPIASAQQPPVPVQIKLTGPTQRAAAIVVPLTVSGTPPSAKVELQRLLTGARWATVNTTVAGAGGRAALKYLPPKAAGRYRLRAVVAGIASPTLTVRTRAVTLAAFGDANFGDGVGAVMDRRGALWPWRGVAPTLRRADIAFGNLECAISNRGAAVPKAFNFRGRPDRLAKVARFAGLDVLNLANNHAGDFGMNALLDTVRAARQAGVAPVGAGATISAARRPRVITRLGLRVAFVGFSDIGPASFFAGSHSPGTSNATNPAIAASVRAARRHADVVIATFHWGIEGSTTENARQRAFAQVALSAGATAIIAAHPHVLQPVRRTGAGRHRLIAYSLGNFVWSAGSALTSRTAILRVRLSGQGVEGHTFLPARIENTRPRLLGR